MSSVVTAQVWKVCARNGVKGAKLTIMLRLADFADQAYSCFPSITTISKETGLGRSTVTTAIRELEQEGWLSRKHRKIEGTNKHTSNRYYLNKDRLDNLCQLHDKEKCANKKSESDDQSLKFKGSEFDALIVHSLNHPSSQSEPPPVHSLNHPSSQSEPDPSLELSIEPSLEPNTSNLQKSDRIDYQAIQKTFNQIMRNAPAVSKMTDKRKRLVKKLFRDFDLTVEKFQAYLEYIQASPECQWMFEVRPRGNGQFWQPKSFDYFVSEDCYLKVKEQF